MLRRQKSSTGNLIYANDDETRQTLSLLTQIMIHPIMKGGELYFGSITRRGNALIPTEPSNLLGINLSIYTTRTHELTATRIKKIHSENQQLLFQMWFFHAQTSS